MQKMEDDTKKFLISFTKIGAAIAFAYLFFRFLFPLLAPFLLGFCLSLLFHPLVTVLQKKYHIPRWLGSLCCILLLLAFFSIVVVGAWNKLYTEATLFLENLPNNIAIFQNAFQQISAQLETWRQSLPYGIQQILPHGGISLQRILPSLVENGSSHSVHAIASVTNAIMGCIVMLISAYFFTTDKENISHWFQQKLPASIQEHYDFAKQELKTSVVAYFKTQLILMLFTFGICMVGLFILQSPYAFLLSVIISIIDAIPFFGSGFILWPGAVLYFITGKTSLAVGYLIVYFLVNLMRQIMQPKILGTQIGLHPLLTLISMYLGLKTLGIWGMILGPILAVLLKAVYETKTSLQTKKHL